MSNFETNFSVIILKLPKNFLTGGYPVNELVITKCYSLQKYN